MSGRASPWKSSQQGPSFHNGIRGKSWSQLNFLTHVHLSMPNLSSRYSSSVRVRRQSLKPLGRLPMSCLTTWHGQPYPRMSSFFHLLIMPSVAFFSSLGHLCMGSWPDGMCRFRGVALLWQWRQLLLACVAYGAPHSAHPPCGNIAYLC